MSRISKSFYRKNKNKIIDIILYGSAVRGKRKPRDIDILIILKNTNKKEYFDIPYKLRKQFERKNIRADVKAVKLDELFDSKLLIRESILIEGYSLIKNKFLYERLGLESYSLFFYSLKNLKHKEKIKFQYAFKGRGTKKGFLEIIKGEHISPGVVSVSIFSSEKFKEFLEFWEVEYKQYKGFLVKC